MITHHFAMTSPLLIKILEIDKFGVFSSDIDFKTKMDISRYDISLIINQCHLEAIEGSFWRTQSVRQPRTESKRSALVTIITRSKDIPQVQFVTDIVYIYIQARFACLRCAAGGQFVYAGGALWAPGVTLINYMGYYISKYVCPTVIMDIAREVTKFVNF